MDFSRPCPSSAGVITERHVLPRRLKLNHICPAEAKLDAAMLVSVFVQLISFVCVGKSNATFEICRPL
jgi:hypothetical protein